MFARRDAFQVLFALFTSDRLAILLGKTRHHFPESAPIKRIIQDSRESGSLIDATYGRRTRAVIVMDSGHVILSAIQPETVANRFVQNDEMEEEPEEDE